MVFAFTLGTTAYASHNSEESLEDILPGCRDGNILVFRFVNHQYVCTNPLTASSWVRLGLAEIIQKQPNEKQSESVKENNDINQEKILKNQMSKLTH